MMRYFFLGVLLAGCTHGGGNGAETDDSIASSHRPKAKATATATVGVVPPAPIGGSGVAPPTAVVEAAQAAPVVADSPCTVFEHLPGEPPVVLNGKSVVLTRLLKPCVTPTGQRGYDKATPYLAMGFPCSGGGGRLEIKGHYNNPKMVTFLLGTDCPLAPSGREAVQQLIGKTYELPATTKLAAYTPFVVQYWEVPTMVDADVGYALELRSAPAVEGLWRRFLKQETVRVHLYGRENTWVPGEGFYFVEADLKQTGRSSFQLQAVQVKVLGKEQIAAVKQRCEALRPSRNCSEVF